MRQMMPEHRIVRIERAFAEHEAGNAGHGRADQVRAVGVGQLRCQRGAHGAARRLVDMHQHGLVGHSHILLIVGSQRSRSGFV